MKGQKNSSDRVSLRGKHTVQLLVYTFRIVLNCRPFGQKRRSLTVNLPPCVVEIMCPWLLAEPICPKGTHLLTILVIIARLYCLCQGTFFTRTVHKGAIFTHRLHPNKKTCIPAHGSPWRTQRYWFFSIRTWRTVKGNRIDLITGEKQWLW